MADHSHINTDLDIEEVVTFPATIDPDKLYFRTGDQQYFRPEYDNPDLQTGLRLIPLIKASNVFYDSRDLGQLAASRRLLATSSALNTSTLTRGIRLNYTWSRSDYATKHGITVGGSGNEERLIFPSENSVGWIGIYLAAYRGTGVEGNLFIPWGGFAFVSDSDDHGSCYLTTYQATNPDRVEVRTEAESNGNWRFTLRGAGTNQRSATHVRAFAIQLW